MNTMKRIGALLLALAMLLSIAACGKAPETAATPQSSLEATPTETPKTESRQELEQIADLLGDGQLSADMTDEELSGYVEGLIENLDQKSETQSGVTLDPEVYDQEGAMKIPFDQAYPELVEDGTVTYAEESLLVKLSNGTGLTDGLKAAGVAALEEVVPMEKETWYEAKLTEGTDAEAALTAVRNLSEVKLAEYNFEIQTAALDSYKDFDDKHKEEFDHNEHHKDQWHHHHCGIPDAYEKMVTEGGDPSVVVAVIDSGVDYDHEDLKDNMWYNTAEIPDNGIDDDGNGYVDDYYGIDLVAGKGSADDDNGHGTHVAGIIAARNNNVGVLGLAYNVKIMPIKAAAHNGTLNQANIAKAVLYAYSMGAEVINMSFGGSACSIAVQDALATAYTRCVLVASAGNSGLPNQKSDYLLPLPNYPAALSYVLGVMSVDENGVESSFTNWDVAAFNGIEYELYAPGENIMSTLPGDRYGYLSGTSMAAPIVTAMAAILRSEFADRDKYPTKFIYGQLASTSDYYATCCDPEGHKVGGKAHNLPQIVNLDAALTKLPKPEVSVQDFAIFDTADLSDKNNGDGVIDAGETIALGLTLQNRWGMSENTLVTIDTLENGISDPYVTIVNPTVDYGSVGTYSTQDAGGIYTDVLLTGWEHPFLIKIADDIPNDYRMTFHVTVKCENALDETDTTVYTSNADVDLTARHGVILPSVIEEDMVLTKNNLYIIPNATVIQEGVTVRVEPGTHIQFWSDDPSDPYADSYIAYLLVNGNFLVEGTKEDPVYIYPSQLMDRYGVEISASDAGYVSLTYADVTNFFYYKNHTGTSAGNTVNFADHCTFRSNYSGKIYCRYLSGGTVRSSSTDSGSIGEINAKDCVFYKIATAGGIALAGSFDRCVFTDCGISFNGSYERCVFLGNSLLDTTYSSTPQNSAKNVSSLTLPTSASQLTLWYRPETGTTYVSQTRDSSISLGDNFADYLCDAFGGNYVKIETADENEWLKDKYVFNSHFSAGVTWDKLQGSYVWYDGTPLDPTLFPNATTFGGYYSGTNIAFSKGQLTISDTYSTTMFEIPGLIKPEDITFHEYTVDLDLDATYQLAPKNTPVQVPVDQFLFESTDEAVVTVNETGLVTPMGLGTADVWVWSLDKAVRNRVTFTVRDYVALTGIAFPESTMELEVGTSAYALCVLTPADTTRHNVTYTSSDPSVVTVEHGMLTAVSKGTATVTATCEGLTATVEVSTWVRAASLTFKTYVHTRAAEACDTSLPELVVTPANADLDLEVTSNDPSILSVEDGKLICKKAGRTYLTITDRLSGLKTIFSFTVTTCAPVIEADVLAAKVSDGTLALPAVTLGEGAPVQPVWTILDPAVAQVKDGAIALNGAGTTTLRVTDPRTGLTDEISLYITETDTPRIKELQTCRHPSYSDVYAVALMDDGSLYYWNASDTALQDPRLLCTDVKTFDTSPSFYTTNSSIVNNRYVSALLQDNSIAIFSLVSGSEVERIALPAELNIVAVDGYRHTGWSGALFALTDDGSVYALGYNDYGLLGIGTTDAATEFTKVLLSEAVKQVAFYNGVTYYLTQDGNLYVSGGQNLQAATPIMIARNVTWLDRDGVYYVSNDRMYSFSRTSTAPTQLTDGCWSSTLTGYTMLDVMSDYNALAYKDGSIWMVTSNYGVPYEKFRLHSGVAAAATVYASSYSYYALTEDGLLVAKGSAQTSYYRTNAFLGMTTVSSIGDTERPIFLPVVQPQEQLTLVSTNLDEANVLSAEALELTMSKQLLTASATIYENGTAMVATRTMNQEVLQLVPSVGFVEGAQYKVVISADGITGVSNVIPAQDIVVEFTYKAPVTEEAETPETDTETTQPAEPVVYETIVDETVERNWTGESLIEALNEHKSKTGYNPTFIGNAILNPVSTDTEVNNWLRFQTKSISAGTYEEIPFGQNWWGTTNETAIGLQMIDYTDFITYARLMYAPYLTEAPSDTFPFVTNVTILNQDGQPVTTVGNEKITVRITFNRDMDTSIPLLVRFGSYFPYGDYEIEGAYVDARTWEATYTLNTLIENGLQCWTISNGCSATDDLALQTDRGRFGFTIDTTAAQALIMQGTATDTGIMLQWTQDDFDTLMGYNVYRATKEDGLYTRLNKTVIPADTTEFFDDTVEPGVVYYYNFTVVKTDLTESTPSGKISIMSKDTMAPSIYHTPVSSAFTGSNLVITATVTDNLSIAYANLWYRVTGTDSWKTVRMNKLNDKYSAIIPAADITLAGVDYYIEAFDGVSCTYKGSEAAPYTITVQEAVSANALGDVNGDGVITNLDALILLQAINDLYNMTAEEFARADINGDGELAAMEALRILHYVSGKIGSVAF